MDIRIPAQIATALETLNGAGQEAFLVGGCVRDALFGRTPHDFDLATSALPEETCALFSAYRTVKTGLKHGTVTVLIDGMPIEITTYRLDGAYADHRHPEEVVFTSSLVEDLARRDFTINAMAYHPSRGLIDPFSGREDLALGCIRAVGDPEKRFDEDALRILRALRFAARFGFSIEERTAAAARSRAETLSRIAAERVREELFGILLADHAAKILTAFCDVISTVIPEGVATPRLSSLEKILPLRLAEFLSPCGEVGAAAALRRLRADNRTVRTVSEILHVFFSGVPASHAGVCRLLRAISPDTVRLSLALRAAHGYDDGAADGILTKILADGDCYRMDMLAIGGEDAATLGIPRGPLLGRALEEAFLAVTELRVPNEREALLAFLSEKA